MTDSRRPRPLLFATLFVCTAASIARAAAFQPTLDTTGNAVGSTITDTGVAAALLSMPRRALLQGSGAIPNYAASSSLPAGTSSGGSASGSSNQDPFAASSSSTPGQSPDTLGQSGGASSTGSSDQNPFGSSSSSPAAAGGTTAADSSTASSSSGGVLRDGASEASPAEAVPVPEKPPPVGPDPADWQQTQDFPPGTRLTHAQGTLLLLGRGLHG